MRKIDMALNTNFSFKFRKKKSIHEKRSIQNKNEPKYL
ncbi:hypothetical protein LEP1GSC039_3095 [Leptospira santarosai str. 2000027870]|nr:hypothetical protein LEP1GSC039_3095 [Leptospira santarosai str. 2000027870]